MDSSTQYQQSIAVINEVKKAVTGKDDCICKAFAAILAGGHILIEDVPGVGKTTLAIAFSRVMGLNNHRVQFTPDVMPADILGFSMYRKDTGSFSYHPGTIMCNLFLADEINRTSPKTQSALLEVMEEGMVTVDGVSHAVPKPFIVMASGSAGAAQLRPVLDTQGLTEIREMVETLFVHDSIYAYVAKLVKATRENAYIELGVSPRGTIACVRMARAWAFLHGRSYVLPEDVADIFLDIAKHRIVLNTKARVTHVAEEAVLQEILGSTRQPASYMEKAGARG